MVAEKVQIQVLRVMAMVYSVLNLVTQKYWMILADLKDQ